MISKFITTASEKHRNQTFIEIQKTIGRVKPGDQFKFLEFGNQTFIRYGYCVHVEVKKLSQIDERISFLDKNMELEDYLFYLQSIRKFGDNDLISILTFTSKNNIKDLCYAPINR